MMEWNCQSSFAEDEEAAPSRVGLLYACDGQAWESHLRQVLQHQRSRTSSRTSSSSSSSQLTAFNCSLMQLERDLDSNVMPSIADADLQVVIVSPALLSFVAQRGIRLDGVLDMNRTLALLLGVTEQAISDRQIEGLRSFPMWRKLTLRDKNRECIEDFVTFVHSMLNRTVSYQREDVENSDDTVFEEKFTVATAYCDDNSYLVLYLMLNEQVDPDEGQLAVWIRGVTGDMPCQQLFDANWKNPYTAYIFIPTQSLPDHASAEVVFGGTSWGEQPIRHPHRLETFGKLLDALTSPVDFMCQSLGLNPGTTEELDNALTEMFKENCPPDISQLTITNDIQGIETRGERYPSLLHLAATLGLVQLCGRLVDTPSGERALMIRNAAGQLPAELAATAGHQMLADQLQQATELSSLSKLIPEVDQRWSGQRDPDVQRSLDEWMRPDAFSGAQARPKLQAVPQSPVYAEVGHEGRVLWMTHDLGLDTTPSGPYLTMHKEEKTPEQDQVRPSSPRVRQPPPPVPPRRHQTPSESSEQQQAAGHLTDLSSAECPITPASARSDEQLAGSDDSGSTYRSAEDSTGGLPKSPVLPTGASGTKFTLPPGAYQPATRGPRMLKTAEDEMRELLYGYNNNEYTLSELKDIANSWTQRSNFEQFLRDNNKPKMDKGSQASGFFSRFFSSTTKGKTRKSLGRNRHGSSSREPGSDNAPPMCPTFKSYAAPLDQEMRKAVAESKLMTQRKTLALAEVSSTPALATVTVSPAATAQAATTPTPAESSTEDLHMSMYQLVPSTTAEVGEPWQSGAPGIGVRPTMSQAPHLKRTQEQCLAPNVGSQQREPPPVPPRRTPRGAGPYRNGTADTI